MAKIAEGNTEEYNHTDDAVLPGSWHTSAGKRRLVPDAVTAYIAGLYKIPLLTADEEKAVGARIQQGDQQAFDLLVTSNLRLVVDIARKYYSQIPLADRIQYGNQGLMRAARKFKPDKGAKFSTYATWWIKQALQRALSSDRLIALPIHVGHNIGRLSRHNGGTVQSYNNPAGLLYAADLLAEEGKKPSLAKAANVLQAWWRRDVGSLEHIIEGDETTSPVHTFIADPDDQFEASIGSSDINSLLDCLPNKERLVVTARLGLDGTAPQTLEAIGQRFGLSRERIRQIEAKALKTLRKRIALQDGLTSFKSNSQVPASMGASYHPSEPSNPHDKEAVAQPASPASPASVGETGRGAVIHANAIDPDAKHHKGSKAASYSSSEKKYASQKDAPAIPPSPVQDAAQQPLSAEVRNNAIASLKQLLDAYDPHRGYPNDMDGLKTYLEKIAQYEFIARGLDAKGVLQTIQDYAAPARERLAMLQATSALATAYTRLAKHHTDLEKVVGDPVTIKDLAGVLLDAAKALDALPKTSGVPSSTKAGSPASQSHKKNYKEKCAPTSFDPRQYLDKTVPLTDLASASGQPYQRLYKRSIAMNLCKGLLSKSGYESGRKPLAVKMTEHAIEMLFPESQRDYAPSQVDHKISQDATGMGAKKHKHLKPQMSIRELADAFNLNYHTLYGRVVSAVGDKKGFQKKKQGRAVIIKTTSENLAMIGLDPEDLR